MSKKRSTQQLLLLDDVDNLGRKGDLVLGAKPGFIRNFLLPKGVATIADKRTIRMQERLKAERAKQSEEDRTNAETMAAQLKDKSFSHTVKVDSAGHLYGSVSAQDIALILAEEGLHIDRKMVLIGHPIRALGSNRIPLRLKEGVQAEFSLRVQDEEGRIDVIPTPAAKPKEEPFADEQDAEAAIDREVAVKDAKQEE